METPSCSAISFIVTSIAELSHGGAPGGIGFGSVAFGGGIRGGGEQSGAGRGCRQLREGTRVVWPTENLLFGGRKFVESGGVRRDFERLTFADGREVLFRPEIAHRAVRGQAQGGPVHANVLLGGGRGVLPRSGSFSRAGGGR